MAKEQNIGKKIAVGAVLAAAAGYVAGVLTAPKSGKETRKDIKDTAVKTKLTAEKELKKLHSELGAKLTSVKAEVKKLKGSAKTEADKAIKTATNAKEKARELLSTLHDGDADDPELSETIANLKKAQKSLEKFLKK